MPDAQPPTEVRRLLEERTAARRERDWARADALRDELVALGWEPQDTASGSTVRPTLAATADRVPPARLDEPASVGVSIQLLLDGHPDDLIRLLRGLARHAPSSPWELVVVANGTAHDPESLLASVDLPVSPVVIAPDEPLGWADARTLGLQRSSGEITVVLDSSLEPTGDFTLPLLAAFEDETVGIAGGWGLTSEDGRHFEEAPPGEVDAVEAYCLAVRRQALQRVRGFDHRFRFYRNADLDFSFAVRDAGWRAVRTEPLPLERHEHRGYASLPEAERDRLSKRNFYRFLDRWGDRPDLLLANRER